jgi:hypothetical protein
MLIAYCIRAMSAGATLFAQGLVSAVAAFGYLSLTVSPASPQELLANTFLVDISMGSARSDLARDLSVGGYELADGTPVNFENWYGARVPDLNFRFLTVLTSATGLVWGFSLGERGAKYRIDPGLWLGFVYRWQLTSQSTFSISATTMIGGDFRERSCLADFGEIGGLQRVNCRLAASELPPEDTLQLLVNRRGYSETRVTVRYERRF